jgi:hypothetical protein
MWNKLNRAESYRDLADECRGLAATTLSAQMRSRYSRMAEIYTTLAEAEETRSASLQRLAAPVSSQKRHGRKNSVLTDCVSRTVRTVRPGTPGRYPGFNCG